MARPCPTSGEQSFAFWQGGEVPPKEEKSSEGERESGSKNKQSTALMGPALTLWPREKLRSRSLALSPGSG